MGPAASEDITKNAPSSTLHTESGGESDRFAIFGMAVAASAAGWPFAAVALARAGATKGGEETGGICASSS